MPKSVSKILVVLLVCCSGPVWGKMFFQYSFNYHTFEEDFENSSYSAMRNMIFLGPTFGKNEKFALGQSVILTSGASKGGTEADSSTSSSSSSDNGESEISLTEIGPRFIWFWNQAHTILFSAAWHPYVVGTRTTIGAEEQELRGSSYLVSLGVQTKVGGKIKVGGAINYYSMSVEKYTVDSEETEDSSSYTSIFPTLELSWTFK